MNPATDAPVAVDFGRFRALLRRRELLVDNRPVELGGRAFDVLMALIEARGAVVGKNALMERVWPGRVVEENNLAFQISALRKALADNRCLIRTISGRGYQFTGEVRWVSAPPGMQTTARMPDEAAPSQSRRSTNLPEAVSELIGRDAELCEVLDLSASHRLVTLTGTGGIGKTRLGFEAARQQLPRFPDGVWAADLAPSADADLVPVLVAAALGLELTPAISSTQSVANALRSKQLLLVLDNCEHVIDAVARMAEALLRANPVARVIATSREPLRAEGEWVYMVPPLAVPEADSPDSEDPFCYGAVRLFAARARTAAAGFSHDARGAATVAHICRRLDGIPLAIELAAARASSLGMDELAAGLDDRFRLLARGRRTALPRHQTLRGALDWSYELLTEAEQAGLCRLAIFAGAFTFQDACAVVADGEIAAADVDDCVANLVAKSLVNLDTGGELRRCRLLETTRAYALEKLVESGEFDTVARRHASRYLELFESAQATAETVPTHEWLADHTPKIDNLRAALDWAFSPSGDASIGVALTAAAVPLWMHLSFMEECRSRIERALAAIAAGASGDARREMQLDVALAASLLYTRGAVSEVGAVLATALEIAVSLGDVEYQLRSLWGLWHFHISSGEQRAALTVAQRFHALAEQRADPNDCLIGERMVGSTQHYLGELASGRRHLERALAHSGASVKKSRIIRFEGGGDRVAQLQTYLARILWLQGLPDRAMHTAESAIENVRATDHAMSLGGVLALAACPIALWSGDLAAAERYAGMLIDDSTRHGLARWQVFGLCYQAMLVMRRGEVGNGLHLLRTAFDQPAGVGSIPRFFAHVLAEGLGSVGQVADGLATIEGAIDRSERAEERWATAEMLRIKGELLLLQGASGGSALAEGQFQQALDLARRQGALSWELRIATSLARLWRDQARTNEARELLAPVCDRVIEGFATADLRAAKSLIEEMA